MNLKHRAIGTFSNYAAAEAAVRELQDNRFSMDQVSVIGRDIDQHTPIAGAHSSDRLADAGKHFEAHETEAEETAKKGAVAGGTLGGLTGLLVGLGAIAIPGVGPVMLAGAAATAIASAISGGVIGAAAGGLVGGLIGLGIPEDRAKVYGDRVSQGDYLVMIEGSEADIALAQSILSKHGIHEWYSYHLTNDAVAPVTNISTHQPRL